MCIRDRRCTIGPPQKGAAWKFWWIEVPVGQREAVRTSGGNANGCITSDISVLGTRNILDKNDKNRGLSKKVEVFDHPDIAENSYALCKAIIYHPFKKIKNYVSKNLYFIDHKHTNWCGLQFHTVDKLTARRECKSRWIRHILGCEIRYDRRLHRPCLLYTSDAADVA